MAADALHLAVIGGALSAMIIVGCLALHLLDLVSPSTVDGLFRFADRLLGGDR